MMKKDVICVLCLNPDTGFQRVQRERKRWLSGESSVSIRLVYPEGNGFEPVEGVSVTLKNTSGSTTFSQSTNAEGVAVLKCRKVSMKFRLPTNGWPMPKCIFSMD